MFSIFIALPIVLLLAVPALGALRWVVLRNLLSNYDGVTPELLESWLADMLANGGHHSVVHVRVRGGPEGLRFRLEGPPDRRELFMWYPNAEWSRAYFEQIRHRAQSDRLPITFSPTGNSREPEFIRIAFGTDAVAARKFAMRVLTRVYDASLADECSGIVLKHPLSGDELAALGRAGADTKDRSTPRWTPKTAPE